MVEKNPYTIHADARITVDREWSVAAGHRIADEVEQAMIHDVRKLSAVMVHIDPCSHESRTAVDATPP